MVEAEPWIITKGGRNLAGTPRIAFRLKGRRSMVKTLEQALGDDHNLAVLRDTVAAAPERYGGAESVAVVFGCIDKRQRALRLQALEIGPRLFAPRAKRLRRRAERWIGTQED